MSLEPAGVQTVLDRFLALHPKLIDLSLDRLDPTRIRLWLDLLAMRAEQPSLLWLHQLDDPASRPLCGTGAPPWPRGRRTAARSRS